MPASVYGVLSSAGQPLDEATRDRMEPRFGHDFSRVRVHTGPRAATAAQAVHAHAFTVGDHIVFDEGKFAPQTHAGLRLLAHELTHVVQQRRGTWAENGPSANGRSTLRITEPDSTLEREAVATARLASTTAPGATRSFSTAPTPALSPAGCLSDYFNLTAAALSAVGACGGSVVLFLAPEPTTLTKWAAVFATAGCLGAIAWIISAYLALIECLEADPDVDPEEIETMRRRLETLEEFQRDVQEQVGS